MEKFTYQISIEAPSREIADLVMDSICKENSEILNLMKATDEAVKRISKEKIETPEKTGKEKFLEGLKEFQMVLQIVEKCVADKDAIKGIAQLLGIHVSPLKKSQP